jgi:hypothetical protein
MFKWYKMSPPSRRCFILRKLTGAQNRVNTVFNSGHVSSLMIQYLLVPHRVWRSWQMRRCMINVQRPRGEVFYWQFWTTESSWILLRHQISLSACYLSITPQFFFFWSRRLWTFPLETLAFDVLGSHWKTQVSSTLTVLFSSEVSASCKKQFLNVLHI